MHAMVEVRDKGGDCSLKIDVVLPQGIVGVEKQRLAEWLHRRILISVRQNLHISSGWQAGFAWALDTILSLPGFHPPSTIEGRTRFDEQGIRKALRKHDARDRPEVRTL
jgi:hypothetical protein